MATGSVASDASSVSVCSAAAAQPLSPLLLLPVESEQSNSSTSEFDCNIEDAEESQAVDDLITSGCSCTLGKLGTPCSKQLSRSRIESMSQDHLDRRTRNELDLIILSQIHSHQSIGDVGSEVHPTMQHIRFYIHGLQLCITTYQYVHCISRKCYQNLVKHYHEHGLSPRVHGNTKCLPANSLLTEDRDYSSQTMLVHIVIRYLVESPDIETR